MPIKYNPDVLSCLANLSNDEVFTPPSLANEILDMLPQELFQSEKTTFLDPCVKSGVFLREIAKRLIKGLENKIPDLQERLNHIYSKQLFGIAITELTAMLTRRSLYCSKHANGKYSLCSEFTNGDGNIKFGKIKHTWKDGKCSFCGASQSEYDRDDSLETHAYQFIHTLTPMEIFNMKFDVIIGNPPYQLATGGAQAQATPLYHKFIQQAKKLKPRFLTMIVPSRWFSGGMGLNDFRDEMIHDNHLRVLHDYLNAGECFPGVEIKGGVCYFLWDRDNKGICSIYTHENQKIISNAKRFLFDKKNQLDIFIRYNEAIPILDKILEKKETSFMSIVSSQKPFGLPTNYRGKKQKFANSVKLYATKEINYIGEKEILTHHDWIDMFKILIPKAVGSGDIKKDWLKPVISEPKSCCSETYVVLGPFKSEKEVENVISYINTKFFHFLLGLRKNTQDCLRKVYQFIPLQDFNKSWTDEKLYKKYGLEQKEIDFIESMVCPME